MATVLVVDDDPLVREAVGEALASGGYAVRTAADGRAALAVLEHERPDLVLSAVFMPRLDGWSLAAHLRQRFPGVRVVLMGAVRPAFALGGIDVLPKPVDRDRLLAVVADALA